MFNSKKDISPNQEIKTKESLKVVNIYDEKGNILKSINGVYITHWDKRIYIIEDENNKHLMKLDIAENMMLVTHNVGESDSNGESKYFKTGV